MNGEKMQRLYGFVYLIYLREFINANEDVYKVGCCENIERRKSQYPKGSILLFTRFTTNFLEIETKIKESFRKKYIIRRDLGTEYFEEDHHDMIDDMYNIVKQINTYRKNEFKKEIIQKKEFFNLYEDFIKVNLKLVSDKKSRIKRSDINEYCLTWIHKHPIYKNPQKYSRELLHKTYFTLLGKQITSCEWP